MIQPKIFFDNLATVDINFFAGVPDSLLKDLCAYIEDHSQLKRHIITANEGNAVAIACGYFMATGKSAAVYLQNSGIGNAINPLTSIADSEVYQIPMLLVIGWRGEPGINDEPQHIKQGRITPEQLALLEIPYKIVDNTSDAYTLATWARQQLNLTRAPIAFLVKKGAFEPYKSHRKPQVATTLKREDVLAELLTLAEEALIVSTTGVTSREVFELRVARGESQRDFLTVGGMGHTASIALGVAMGQPDRSVVCIDGDGSVLMHMGALPIIGSLAPCNFIHVLLNNGAHESVGGQPTVGNSTDFRAIALASGYRGYTLVTDIADLRNAWLQLSNKQVGPIMLEVKITSSSRSNLGRPTSTPFENRVSFMNWIAK